MKVLYFTVPSFFDLEISLIRELSSYVDVTVVLVVSPQSMRSSAFSIDYLNDDCDLFQGKDYPQLSKYSHLIDTNIWYIANNPNGSMFSYYKLSKIMIDFINERKFDIIHTTTSNKLSLFLLPFINKFPAKILTVHDPITHHKLSWYRRQLTTFFRNVHKNILILSPSHLPVIKQQDPNSRWNVYQSQLGIYDFLNSYPISDNVYGKYILFFGRIAEYKGVDILARSFLNSKSKSLGVKLLIAGAGHINVLDDMENEDCIVQLNRYIENNELATLIHHSMFIVMPYKTATQSGVLMSAYAFNKPVIVSRVGDFPNTVIDAKTGIIVPPDDVEALTDAIDTMIFSDRAEMSKNIEYMFSDESSDYSWKKIARKMSSTYNEILQK